MVSGLVASPCDQLRIFSGEARLIRIASKSAIGLARSKGLERNKVFLSFLRLFANRRRLLNRRWSLAVRPWPNQRFVWLPAAKARLRVRLFETVTVSVVVPADRERPMTCDQQGRP